MSRDLNELKAAGRRKSGGGEFKRRAEPMQMSCGGNKLCVFEKQSVEVRVGGGRS